MQVCASVGTLMTADNPVRAVCPCLMHTHALVDLSGMRSHTMKFGIITEALVKRMQKY